MDSFIGTILPWAGTFEPRGWAFCQGQTLLIRDYNAVFAILGTTYGGDGVNNFCLPNLQGRVPVGMGQSLGTSNYTPGQTGGVESVSLQTAHLPPHAHTMMASNAENSGLTQAPAPNWTLGAAASNTGGRSPVIVPVNMYNAAAPTNSVPSAPSSVIGSGQAVPVIQPFQVISYIICLQGIFPSRN